MTPWPRDTSRDAFERRIEALRALGPSGRFSAGLALCDEVREGLAATIRARRPGDSDDAVSREVARLLLGDALFEQVFRRSAPAP
ncbi:MAG: hypothetical protein IPL89_01720 [Acidobacteria bacterium]|nr:hypothetical protein [Acidobacteriota bacterium]